MPPALAEVMERLPATVGQVMEPLPLTIVASAAVVLVFYLWWRSRLAAKDVVVSNSNLGSERLTKALPSDPLVRNVAAADELHVGGSGPALEDKQLFQDIWAAVEKVSAVCCPPSPPALFAAVEETVSAICASPSPLLPTETPCVPSPIACLAAPPSPTSPSRQLRRRRTDSPASRPAAAATAAAPVLVPAVTLPPPEPQASSPSQQLRPKRVDSPAPRPAAPVAEEPATYCPPAPAAVAEDSSDEDSFDDGPVNPKDLPPQELALVALINFATYEELIDLKGIGAKVAKSLLAYRATGAQFTCLDDFAKAGLAKTVGPKVLKMNS